MRTEHVPFVPAGAAEITPIQEQPFQVVARCGFMETLTFRRVLTQLSHVWAMQHAGTRHHVLPQPDYIFSDRKPGMAIWWKTVCGATRKFKRASSASIYRPNR